MLRSVALLTVVVLAATCGGLPLPVRSGSLDPLAGTYRAAGSGAALESLTALTKRFSQLHPGVVFRLEDVNAETGVVLVFEGEVDLGFLSRDLRPEERGKVLLVPYAGTGTGLAVNPANPVIGLTRDQVGKIFSGEITDWATVGGTPGQIRVYLREQGSATRASFEAYFFGAKPAYVSNAVEVVESAATYRVVRDFKDAIAMVTAQKATIEDPTLKIIAIDGVAATVRNVNSGAYPVRRPIFLSVHPDPARVKPAVRALLEFVKGPEGQEILARF